MSLDETEGPHHVWQVQEITRRSGQSKSKGHINGGAVFLLHGEKHASCASCAKVKPLTEFTKDVQRKTGHSSYCRTCMQARRKIAKNNRL